MQLKQIGMLQSMQVGTPAQYGEPGAQDRMERSWQTSFFRIPTTEPRWLYTTHLAGNMQADTKNHGTLSQAVLMYAASHYPLWQRELDLPEIGPGGFAENFTVEGLSEETSCIGDIYALGEAQIQVTGPRYPCWKIERRWNLPGLTARAAQTGRTGWYCRVLQEGMIEPGMPVHLVERPFPRYSNALVNDFGHGRNKNRELAQELAACPLLPEFWGELILSAVNKG